MTWRLRIWWDDRVVTLHDSDTVSWKWQAKHVPKPLAGVSGDNFVLQPQYLVNLDDVLKLANFVLL